jgi:hypothetical protein
MRQVSRLHANNAQPPQTNRFRGRVTRYSPLVGCAAGSPINSAGSTSRTAVSVVAPGYPPAPTHMRPWSLARHRLNWSPLRGALDLARGLSGASAMQDRFRSRLQCRSDAKDARASARELVVAQARALRAAETRTDIASWSQSAALPARIRGTVAGRRGAQSLFAKQHSHSPEARDDFGSPVQTPFQRFTIALSLRAVSSDPSRGHRAVQKTSRRRRQDHTSSGRLYSRYRRHNPRRRAARFSATFHRRVGIRQIGCCHASARPDTTRDTILLVHH